MNFHSEFEIKKLLRPIAHGHKLFLIGSCFTENIGEKLRTYKFEILENPNGILFNPVSVAEAVNQYLENKKWEEKDLFFYNEAWHSWKHHSRFSGITPAESLEKINGTTEYAHQFLESADYMLIT